MRRPTAGFTMVEVLVAVLLLAVGLVGALAMQVHAMRTRQESALLTEALQAAASLADRIRANSAQSSSYLGFQFDAATGEADAPPAACSAGAPCDAAALARRELDDFRLQLERSLPAARAAVCRDAAFAPGGQAQWSCTAAAGAPVVIKIGWHSRDRGAGATAVAAAPAVVLPVVLPDAVPVSPSGAAP